MQINIYNHTGNPELYLFMDYADNLTSGVKNFSNQVYEQPWKEGKLKLTEPHVISFDWINSGTFWYLITNETGAKTISSNPKTAMGTADPNWVGGFFELTSLKSDKLAYLDVTNVDQIGLFCGMDFKVNGKAEHLGYGLPATEMISGMIKACALNKDTKAKVDVIGTDKKTYTKLWGPTVPEVVDQYAASYDQYIEALTKNGTELHITSDSTLGSNHGGTQYGAFNFVGKFGQPTFDLPEKCPIRKEEIVLWFTADDCVAKKDKTYLFFTKDAINGGTIMSGSSAKGMFIYPAAEYPDPKDQSKILKGGWASDVSLNWTATGANAVADTTCFQAMIDSIGRNVVTALNLGYIPVDAAHKTFDYGDPSSYADAATQEKYLNRWNAFITEHSDSYGMAYSDGTHAKVQFHPDYDGVINCFILPQDDPNTKNWWSKDKG